MAGPQDLEMLFDVFLCSVRQHKENAVKVMSVKERIEQCFKFEPLMVPSERKPKKVLVLGSGGLSIGQAGEFDYSGSQVSFLHQVQFLSVGYMLNKKQNGNGLK